MFEGANTFTLCKAAVMKIIEEYINKSLAEDVSQLKVTDVQFDCGSWTAKFTVVSKTQEANE